MNNMSANEKSPLLAAEDISTPLSSNRSSSTGRFILSSLFPSISSKVITIDSTKKFFWNDRYQNSDRENEISPSALNTNKSFIFPRTINPIIIIVSGLLIIIYLTSQKLINQNNSIPFLRQSTYKPLFSSSGIIFSLQGNAILIPTSDITAIATANYTRNMNNNGWNYLQIEIKSSHIIDASTYFNAMRAAGYLEGYLTCQDVKDFYLNYYNGVFEGENPTKQTLEYLQNNYDWMKTNADLLHDKSEYWYIVKGVLSQLEGLLEGSIDSCGTKHKILDILTFDNPTMLHLLLLNANGDLSQISQKYNSRFDDGSFSDDQPSSHSSHKRDKTHCSAFIKPTEDYQDIFFGHSTWDDYQCGAPRTIKHYNFPVIINGQVITSCSEQPAQYIMHFSSYPGYIASIDDFYLISKSAGDKILLPYNVHLAIMETSLTIYNESLLKYIHPSTVISWMRARVANYIANSGEEWILIFSQYASGTYANQWMILNLNKFYPGLSPYPGFLHILEEIPGLISHEDVTNVLISQGYWASYNQPFFKDISIKSGTSEQCTQDEENCYDLDPRARIFHERHSLVHNMSDLQSLLGYNKFQSDPLSKGDSCKSISCRGDLESNKSDRRAYGTTDCKTTSANMALANDPSFFAKQGPSTETQKPFCWASIEDSGTDRPYKHIGHPDCFNYNFQKFPSSCS